ncbi:MAG TPA: hypothetical protein VHD39_06855 [Acidimicrobiales bacterium]|nr:hypothetical protein [Acidimicrobiales bacterium]
MTKTTSMTSPMARVASEPRPTATASQPMFGGRVTGVQGHTIVVRGRGGTTTTVVETSSTSYTTLGRAHTPHTPHAATASSASAVRVGDHVGVRGTANADGTVTATSVTVFSAPPFGPATPSTGAARASDRSVRR